MDTQEIKNELANLLEIAREKEKKLPNEFSSQKFIKQFEKKNEAIELFQQMLLYAILEPTNENQTQFKFNLTELGRINYQKKIIRDTENNIEQMKEFLIFHKKLIKIK